MSYICAMLRKLLIKYLDRPSWPAVAVDVVFITMLTFGFLWLLEYDPYSILEPTGDFSSGDYYDRLYHRNVDLPVDTNVVIVATDDISAAGMPDALRLVASFEPAAIGLDLIFRTQGSVTDDLLDVIDSIPIIVLPVELAYDDATDRLYRGHPSLVDSELPDKPYATVSFPPLAPHSTLREFYITARLADGDSIESMASALCRLKNPALSIPREDTQMINFNLTTPERLAIADLADPDKRDIVSFLLKDKIVLMGDADSPYDHISTSISDRMPGIEVHAAAIATLLQQQPVRQLHRGWLLFISILFITATAVICAKFDEDADLTKNFSLLGLKFFFIAVILVGGYWLYVHYALRADFSKSIALVFFSMMVCDFWFPIKHYLKDKLTK